MSWNKEYVVDLGVGDLGIAGKTTPHSPIPQEAHK